MAVNFISSKDSDEIMHSNSDNTETLIVGETNENIEELFESLLQRYKKNLEEPMKGSEIIFDGVNLLYYKCLKICCSHKISRSGSYIDSPKWLKNKKATINPKNNDEKCFQYAVTVALNYQDIKYNPERISNIKPFMDQHNCKEIDFPSDKKEWNDFEKE